MKVHCKNLCTEKMSPRRMSPEYFVTRKKYFLRNKFISTCKHVIVKATAYNTKYYNTAGSHYNFRGIFSFSLESYTLANACQKFIVLCPFCLAVQRNLSFSCWFCWFFFHSFGWLLSPGFHHYMLTSSFRSVISLQIVG